MAVFDVDLVDIWDMSYNGKHEARASIKRSADSDKYLTLSCDQGYLVLHIFDCLCNASLLSERAPVRDFLAKMCKNPKTK